MKCDHCNSPDLMTECHWAKPPCARRRAALQAIDRANRWAEAGGIILILVMLAVFFGIIVLL